MTIGNQPIVLDNLTHNYDFTDYVSGATITNMLSSAESASLSNSPDHNKLGYIELDGNDQHITLDNDYGMGDSGPEMTLELGFRIPTGASNTIWLLTTNGGSVSIDSANSAHTFALARDSNSKLTFATLVGSNSFDQKYVSSTEDLPTNVWIHLCVRVGNNGSSGIGLNLKVNNVQYSNLSQNYKSGGLSSPYRFNGANNAFVVGRDGRTGSNYYPLEVAYFRRYSVKLTDLQVTQNYNHHAGRFGAY